MSAKAEQVIARDVRVDRVGYAQELLKLWADPIKSSVKARMRDQKLNLVTGDRYEGKLAYSSTLTIDGRKFYKLLKAGTITEKDFLAALRVSKDAASEFMSAREIEAISDSAAREPSLTIVKQKGIDLALADVIAGINAAAVAVAQAAD